MTQHDRGAQSASAEGAPIAYLPWVEHDEQADAPRPSIDPADGVLLAELQQESDDGERADALVLRKLARRGMSQREVEIELSRELDTEQVITAVQRYIRLGYIDDERLAEQILRVQRERKGMGDSSIWREFEMRGIPSAVATRLLGEVDADDELQRATELAAARLRRLAAEQPAVQERRVTGFLMRRGYSSAVTSRAIRAAQSHAE